MLYSPTHMFYSPTDMLYSPVHMSFSPTNVNTSDIDNITMKDIFWRDLLKLFFELKSKEQIPLNVDSII